MILQNLCKINNDAQQKSVSLFMQNRFIFYHFLNYKHKVFSLFLLTIVEKYGKI